MTAFGAASRTLFETPGDYPTLPESTLLFGDIFPCFKTNVYPRLELTLTFYL